MMVSGGSRYQLPSSNDEEGLSLAKECMPANTWEMTLFQASLFNVLDIPFTIYNRPIAYIPSVFPFYRLEVMYRVHNLTFGVKAYVEGAVDGRRFKSTRKNN